MLETTGRPEQNLPIIMGVSEEAFLAVESGQKTLEVRLGSNTFSHIKPGAAWGFMTLGTKTMIKVRVRETRKYQTLEELLATEDMEKIAPGKSKEEINKMFQKFFTPEEDVQKHGLVVIDFEKI